MKRKKTDGEVLKAIRDLTASAKTIDARLSMRDQIKKLLESEGLWEA